MLTFLKFLLISLFFVFIGLGAHLVASADNHSGLKKDELLTGGIVLLVFPITFFVFLWVIGYISFSDIYYYFRILNILNDLSK
jgi:hypothetical protein